jgi:DNA modification methylase
MGDARALDLSEASVDLVITSPPYLNAIDYLRGHKMSLIWFGYTIPELREIRSNSIGSERALHTDALKQIKDMVQYIKASVDAPDRLPLTTITRYAQDLVLFSRELNRVCKAGAEVVTVIGNSTLRGNYIQNDALVRMAYQGSGFQSINRSERDLPENRRYLPVRTSDKASSMAKRMRTEVVLTVVKE